MHSSEVVFPSELSRCMSGQEHDLLKIFHLNVRSAKNKTTDLDCLFSEVGIAFDIIMLTETWYDNETDVFKLPQYKTFCVNRTKGRGGGVCLLIKECVNCELLTYFCLASDDYEVVTVSFGGCIVSVVYRPPDGDIPSFFEFLESFLGFTNDERKKVILGGDLNINMLSDTSSKRELDLLLSMNGCMNVITRPTRITSHSETLIDLFITNEDEMNLKTGVLVSDISDHLPIFMFVKGQHRESCKKEEIKYQSITLSSLKEFRDKISLCDWKDVLSAVEPNEAYDAFLKTFIRLYKICFPYKIFKTCKKIKKPWITPSILAKINFKNKLYKKFIKSRSIEHLSTFKDFRNQLTKEIKKARRSYYNSVFLTCDPRSDIIWKKINTVLQRSNLRSQIQNLLINGKLLTGSELANEFNDFFVNLEDLQSSNKACDNIISLCDSIFLEPVTDCEIVNIFSDISNSRSCDADGMQSRPVKYVIDIIAPYLTYIFNLSLSQGVFPKKMQRAQISVLYKKGDRNDLGNYRPVSILPVFSKCLEKALHRRLSEFLNRHAVISTSQYGFRKHMSTQHALLDQKEFILQNLEEKKVVLGIFVDFTKAFDYINHAILTKKLELYGIRGNAVSLIKSYLAHRTQFVSLNSFYSSVKSISKGVPQGSILGPLLFNIYINDIVKISNTAKFVIYADDTSLFLSGNDASQLLGAGNKLLRSLQNWVDANGLKINVNKTKAIFFRSKNKPIVMEDYLTLNSMPIEIVDSFKTLGVIFSQHVTWEKHIEHILPKLARAVGVIRRHRDILPVAVKLCIYNSLFYSIINYCILVWGTTGSTNLQKILLIQKKMLRLFCNAPSNIHTETLFAKYNIIPIHNLYNYRLAIAYRNEETKNSKRLSYLANLVKHMPSYNTRVCEPWIVPSHRLASSDGMLKFQLPHLLNKIAKTSINISCTTPKELRDYILTV